jgi:hypothetical protein
MWPGRSTATFLEPKGPRSGGPGSNRLAPLGCPQNDLPARCCEYNSPPRGWGNWPNRSLPASGSSLSCLSPAVVTASRVPMKMG